MEGADFVAEQPSGRTRPPPVVLVSLVLFSDDTNRKGSVLQTQKMGRAHGSIGVHCGSNTNAARIGRSPGPQIVICRQRAVRTACPYHIKSTRRYGEVANFWVTNRDFRVTRFRTHSFFFPPPLFKRQPYPLSYTPPQNTTTRVQLEGSPTPVLWFATPPPPPPQTI